MVKRGFPGFTPPSRERLSAAKNNNIGSFILPAPSPRTSTLTHASLALLTLGSLDAKALTPQEVFRLAEPAVVQLEALDQYGNAQFSFSAVALAKETLLTQCDLLAAGFTLRVTHRGRAAEARPALRDETRNLCSLSVKGLDLTRIPRCRNASHRQHSTRA